jgi:hypothetical protein
MKTGELLNIFDSQGNKILTGTLVSEGSDHMVVADVETGHNYIVESSFVKTAGKKYASTDVLKKDEKEGKTFILTRSEENKNNEISVKYVITANDKPIWESEEIITNTYNAEFGWSPPDDFDENKLDLIEQKAENGFELMVESFDTFKENISQTEAVPESPKGSPAFAPNKTEPGNKPSAAPAAPSGGGTNLGTPPTGAPAGEAPEGAAPEGEAPKGETKEAPKEGTPPMETTTSKTYKRSILSGKQDLLTNPEHRINPILRDEMKKRHLDSAQLNDLELADRLKDFSF